MDQFYLLLRGEIKLHDISLNLYNLCVTRDSYSFQILFEHLTYYRR